MFERIIRFAIEQRWLVLLAVFGMAALGVFSYQRLAIDAVPDSPMSRCRSTPRRLDILRSKLNSVSPTP